MKDTNQQSAPSPGASSPFFARFLESQHAADDAPAGAHVTMKYPSDRDEGDVGLNLPAEAATAKTMAPPVTHKYPSDRDEYDTYSMPHDGVADARTEPGPSRMTLKYPSDRDEIDPPYTQH